MHTSAHQQVNQQQRQERRGWICWREWQRRSCSSLSLGHWPTDRHSIALCVSWQWGGLSRSGPVSGRSLSLSALRCWTAEESFSPATGASQRAEMVHLYQQMSAAAAFKGETASSFLLSWENIKFFFLKNRTCPTDYAKANKSEL